MMTTDSKTKANTNPTAAATTQPSKKIKATVDKAAMEGEKAHFEATFDVITNEILEDIAQFNLPQNGVEWVKKMLYYTIPGGV
jgi:Tfp pilus assembly protein FimV